MTHKYTPYFKTERLHIRALERGDAARIFAAYGNDPDVARYMTWRLTGKLEDTQKYVDATVDAWEGKPVESASYGYRIELIESDDLIGAIGFQPHNFQVAIGYNLVKKHWGKGYASEALEVLTEYLLELPSVFRVWAVHDIENHASGKVLERCGYQREGIAKRMSIHPNISLEPRDCVMWAKTR